MATVSDLSSHTEPAAGPVYLSLDEYLHTSFHPDCDFVDDHLEERSLGELDHSTLQGALHAWFWLHRKEWKIRVQMELRTRVSETRLRVPDLCLLSDQAPREQVVLTPPLLAVEILSPEDRMSRVLVRLNDYRVMGIPHIWLFDPQQRAAYVYMEGVLQPVEQPRMSLPDSAIYVEPAPIFAALDE